MISRRGLVATLALAATLLAAGCATPPSLAPAEVRTALAPTGTLRVALYRGSPTSLVIGRSGDRAGLTHEIGAMLGERLGVPVQYVELSRAAQVFDAVRRAEADVTVTNASEARMREADFTPPVVRVELGYLVPASSRITSAAQVDQPGVRVGVSEGSSSFAALSRELKSAKLVTATSLDVAGQMLRTGQIDAFATNKAILFELSDQVAGSQVLPGRWGFEHIAIAVPRGRPAAASQWLRDFADELRRSPELRQMIARAGLRGAADD